jgi:WD40 repeat protein
LWSPDGHHVAVYDRAAEGWMDIIDVRDGSRQRVDGIDTSFASEPFFRGDGIFQAVQVGTHHVVEYDVERHTTSDTGIVLPTNILDAAAFHDRLHLSAFGTDEGNVLLVDTAKRKLRVIKSDIGPVYGVAISADGKRVFAGGQFEKGEVFDVATGKRVATLPTPVANLALSPDRTLLATSSFNGRISFYDAVTLRRSGDDMTGVTAFANKMQFTPDGNTLITSGQDSAARLFDVATRRQVGVSLPITLYGVAISPRSNEVAITTDRGVQRFRIDAGALRDAACKAAARNLTTAEWRQYVGGTPRRLCPQWPMRAGG